MTTNQLCISIGGKTYALRVPAHTKQSAEADHQSKYWIRLWPAAEALANHIAEHPDKVSCLNVLEIGAGLGLPGLVAAQWAKYCTITDVQPDAVSTLSKNISENQILNASAAIFDWRQLPSMPKADLLLLSDVNYNPVDFSDLIKLVELHLSANGRIIISTPQRLLAKPFVAALLPWCTSQHERQIDGAYISIFELFRPANK